MKIEIEMESFIRLLREVWRRECTIKDRIEAIEKENALKNIEDVNKELIEGAKSLYDYIHNLRVNQLIKHKKEIVEHFKEEEKEFVKDADALAASNLSFAGDDESLLKTDHMMRPILSGYDGEAPTVDMKFDCIGTFVPDGLGCILEHVKVFAEEATKRGTSLWVFLIEALMMDKDTSSFPILEEMQDKYSFSIATKSSDTGTSGATRT